VETNISKGICVLSFTHTSDEPSRVEFEPDLSSDEKARSMKFAFDRDRISFITARGMLRHLLGRILQISASAVRFDYGKAGKPTLHASMASPGLEFNVSHSGNLIALAFAQGHCVGVDVEQIRPMDDLEEIARQHFSPDEFAELSKLPQAERGREFFKSWVQKEAIAKGTGLGLSLPLSQIALPNSKSPCKGAVLENLPNEENQSWNVADLELPGGYVGAVAFDQSPTQVFHQHFLSPALCLAQAGML